MNVLRTFLMTLFVYLLLPVNTFGQQWKPLDPADIALKAPIVEKDADAEALLWEVYLNDTDDYTTEFVHLLRIKIFTEKGKENHSKIDIPYFTGVSIKDISGRVIKPDGTITELKKDSVFDREMVKYGKYKLKTKSIAVPGIEPGAIIEYKYREVFEHGTNYSKLYFQREIPVQAVRYFLKPHPRVLDPMKTYSARQAGSQFEQAGSGYFKTEMKNVPSFKEEPHMPPEDQIKLWMLVYYAPDVTDKTAEAWWKKKAKSLYDTQKDRMKINDDVRNATTEAIADATTPEQKLERIFNYCKTKIKDINDDASGITQEQKDKIKDKHSPSDTLKRGYANGADINFLFAAMVNAAEMEARMIMVADRSKIFFDPNFTNTYFINGSSVAVKISDQWKFFDPANEYVPYGMLRWQEEGIQVLLCDSKTPMLVTTPLSTPDKSVKQRIAKLKLSEDGDITGDVTVNYTGHHAVEMKEDYDDESTEERENRLCYSVTRRLSTASLSNIKIENVTDRFKPFSYSYKVHVNGYAERTGKRIFLQPAFFQKGIAAMFTASERTQDIYINYPWSEDDQIEIELPPGYSLDNADAPAGIDVSPTAKYSVKLSITKDQKILIFKRQLMFNGLLFPKNMYTNIKHFFDHIHKQDNHAVTLKQSASN